MPNITLSRLKACIFAVGDELLSGKALDTNTHFLAGRVCRGGFNLVETRQLPDQVETLSAALREAVARTDLVLVTGGLGPTLDDMTREAVQQAVGIQLQYNEQLWVELGRFFAQRGRPLTQNNRCQTLVPQQGGYFSNRCGTAPGLWFDCPGCKVVICLPGPPRELVPMWDHEVEPFLRARFQFGPRPARACFRFCAVGESHIDELMRPLLREHPEIGVSSLPSLGRVDVTLTAAQSGVVGVESLEGLVESVQRQLGEFIYAFSLEPAPEAPAPDLPKLEAVVLDALNSKGWRLATAESCTGGMLGSLLTSVPGSSQVYAGGVVAYANEVKMRLLGVPAETLKTYGAVSAETATAMAAGACERLGASAGVAITGVAGPGGGTPEKPAGTVWFGLSVPDQASIAVCEHLSGSREDIRQRACLSALFQLWRRCKS